MPISGYIGAGAQSALDDVLDRRMKEALRLQQEQQHADNVAMERKRIDLQQRAQANLEQERAADRQYREQQVNIAAAKRLQEALGPGDITEQQAGVIEQDPALAGMVQRSQRPIINARPIAGTPPLDASGPQSLPVVQLRPTHAQAEEQRVRDVRRGAYANVAGATNEQERRTAAAEAGGEGVEVEPHLVGPTQQELLDRQLATEKRTNAEYDRRARLQNDLITGRTAATGRQASGTAAAAYTTERARRTVQGVNNLIDRVGPWTVGRGSLLKYIPETDAADFEADLDSLKANIAFGELTAMREASKTGGALGAVSERELALLESTLGALSTTQSPANFRRNLIQIRESIQRWEQERRRLGGVGGGKGDPFNNDDLDDADNDIDARTDALLRRY